MYQKYVFGFVVVLGVFANMSPLRACDDPAASVTKGAAAQVQPAAFTPTAYTAPAQRLNPERAISEINAIRAEAGLLPLALAPALDRAAHIYAKELSTRGDLSHYGLNGSTPVTRIADAGYDAVTVGENLASGQRYFDEVLKGWMTSPSHRRTLLSPNAVHAGLALVYNPDAEYRTFWTMVVAEPF